jgi:hypothetical protein
VPVSIIAGELRTGRILATLPASDGTWTQVLNTAGAVDATVQLRGENGPAARRLLPYLEATRCYLAAVTDDGRVLEAGPIWKATFDDNAGSLKLGASGLWSLWDHRKAIPVLADGTRVQDAVLSWSGVSLGTIAKKLVETAVAHTGGSLPVVLPDDVAGTATRTYPGYELAWVGDRLQELTQVDGGPDVAFEPRLTADGLSVEWVMRTGTDDDPLLHQEGADWIWDRGATKGGVTSLGVDVDATGMAQRAWAIGSGTEVDLMVGEADWTAPLDAGYPLLETDASYTSVIDQGTLDAHALGLVLYAQRPWATWSLGVRADASPTLGEYRPGDWCAVHVPPDHGYLPEGEYRTRVLSFSGDLTTQVSLKLAPTLEAR